MWLCDYITDFNVRLNRIKPKLRGINLTNNTPINNNAILEQLNSYGIDISSYYEVDEKAAVCNSKERKRQLIIQDNDLIIEVEYAKPFSFLNWELLNHLKIETIGEFINDSKLARYFNYWR